MFEVLASDRFEAWYTALPGDLAEEVSLALDVAAELAPGLDPVRGRCALLWFDGGPLPAGSMIVPRHGEGVVQLRDVVRWALESAEFQRRLGELEGGAAVEALLAVERVRQLLSGARWLGALGGLAAPRPRPDPVQLALLEALRHVGLGSRSLEPPGSALCELAIEAPVTPLRIIYGMDLPRARLIAILGEALDRRYYGDSVRFAERYFREYLARGGELTEGPVAPAPR